MPRAWAGLIEASRTQLGVEVPAGVDAGTTLDDAGLDSLHRLELCDLLEHGWGSDFGSALPEWVTLGDVLDSLRS